MNYSQFCADVIELIAAGLARLENQTELSHIRVHIIFIIHHVFIRRRKISLLTIQEIVLACWCFTVYLVQRQDILFAVKVRVLVTALSTTNNRKTLRRQLNVSTVFDFRTKLSRYATY